ncbi:Os08g0228550 [Oryza sativa Japonica Group]|uniref:Os08g0228550 protein n=1 Tax=Oryza sativa subsp. japonica TaxID=39947 RepID=A0A0P0XDB4_ORYSJ|nr:Os08g0228550 [Oryza sativa Japonica Group]
MGQNPFHPHRHQLLPPAAAVNSARTPPPTPHPCLLRRLPLLFSSSLSSAPIKTTKDTPLFRSKYPGYARSFSAPLLVPPLLLLQHCPRYRDPGSTEKIPLFSEPTTVEDLVGALKGGAEKAKNALQRMYMARASNYTDALKNYVESYKEGLKEHLEEEAMGKGHRQGNDEIKPP